MSTWKYIGICVKKYWKSSKEGNWKLMLGPLLAIWWTGLRQAWAEAFPDDIIISKWEGFLFSAVAPRPHVYKWEQWFSDMCIMHRKWNLSQFYFFNFSKTIKYLFSGDKRREKKGEEHIQELVSPALQWK